LESRWRFRNPREAQSAGISIIFQELNLVPGLSIAENIFIGREPLNRLGLVGLPQMNADAAAFAQGTGPRRRPLDAACRTSASARNRSSRSLARSRSTSRVIIMDEPTSAITKHEVEVLFRQIKAAEAQRRRNRLHHAQAGRACGDCRRRGPCSATASSSVPGRFDEVTRDEMIRMMVGRDLSDLFPKGEAHPGGRRLKRPWRHVTGRGRLGRSDRR
jgi:ABC-type sugar transport system ATPase subunit